MKNENYKGQAVMAKRYESKEGADYYPTPPGATKALIRWLQNYGLDLKSKTVLEPATGGGYMIGVLGRAFSKVYTNDLYHYGFPLDFNLDFIDNADYLAQETKADWLITNPPFKLLDSFITSASGKFPNMAFLARLQALEGGKRYETAWSVDPPSWVLVFINRVAMAKNKLAGKKTPNAMAYAWYVWLENERKHPPKIDWIWYET